ncbi:hypothetical protein Tco_0647843 [Tanacetum coccineum]
MSLEGIPSPKSFTTKVTTSDTVDDRYAVSNRSGYAVLICWDEYVVLDRKLDTPYPMEVDTSYSAIDHNSAWREDSRLSYTLLLVLILYVDSFQSLDPISWPLDEIEAHGLPSWQSYIFGGLEVGRYGISKDWIWRIGDFLEHEYVISSLMDTVYWSLE